MRLFLSLFFFAFFLMCFSVNSESITLEEALQKGLSVSYPIKEQMELLKKSKFSYISTIDLYLPRADLRATYTRTISPFSSVSVSAYSDTSRSSYSLSAVVSYRLFDGGERFAKRKAAYISYEKDVEILRSLTQEVVYNIKKYFYEALGKRHVVEAKRDSYETAKKIFDLTRTRYELGLARKSEVLQAQLRMESSHIEYENALAEYEKSTENLKSILSIKSNEPLEVEGRLEKPHSKLEKDDLVKRALELKPEIVLQEKELKRLEMVYKEKKSAWYPKIDAEVQHLRYDTNFFPEKRSDQFVLYLILPIFDGVGRYYTLKGITSEIAAAQANLEEKKREVELEITKAILDYHMSLKNVELYEKLVEEAKSNFEQSLGEYRVGKGDILSLLTSEKDLSSAKERYVSALTQANLALFYLEKVSYLKQY
ncbi:MAG: TolC family protein [Deltaproteobacteria bacterium]|nr:TolC family protein [Deltaproteobacteria bacterium]